MIDFDEKSSKNIILSKTPEIDSRMLPKIFPSENRENQYIPNWAIAPTKEVVAFFDIDIPFLESRVSSKELIKTR